ncbi:MAG: hypothetical protein D6736_06040 [Nitrospinota bacterium]|nr:MAG: hypothetical protein D6736_06040 [Nitrospinota bacterium]
MIIDLHVHSDISDDGMATAEAYLKWISRLRRRYHFDGIVFTEHRSFRPAKEYEKLGRQYEIFIGTGMEAETDCGHFLLYGVNEKLLQRFDFSDVHLRAEELIKETMALGGIAIPSHPGRRVIGFCDYIDSGQDFSGIKAIEHLNGGNKPEENQRAEALMRARNYFGTGGSDAHFVSAVGTYMTAFQNPVHSMEELVEELYKGAYRAIALSEAAREEGNPW